MVEGTAELPYIRRIENSLSKNRADGVNYPEAVRELREANFKSLGQDYLDAGRDAPHRGRTAFHRQNAE